VKIDPNRLKEPGYLETVAKQNAVVTDEGAQHTQVGEELKEKYMTGQIDWQGRITR
jgi:hypothetical protein